MSVRHGSWDSFPDHIRWRQPPAAYLAVQAVQPISSPVGAAQPQAAAATGAGAVSSSVPDNKRNRDSCSRPRGLLGHLLSRLMLPVNPRETQLIG